MNSSAMVNDPFGMGLPSLGDRDVAETVTHFRATVYVSLAGIVLLLYDHILTFADEIQYVWKSRMSLPKVLFLFTRYVVPITVIVSLRAYSGISQEPLSDKFCKGWSSFSLIMGALAIASSNFIVLLRLWVIWERRITLVGWTLAMFFVTQLATLGMAGWIISQLAPSLRYSGAPIRACVLLRRVNFVGLWAPGVAFEVVVFVMTWWNAFERPRTDNQELRTALYRDGTVYFMTIFSLRLVNLILAIIAPITLTNIGMHIIWCLTTLTVCRLVIKLRKLAVDVESTAEDYAESTTPHDGIVVPLGHDIHGHWSWTAEGRYASDQYELRCCREGTCG